MKIPSVSVLFAENREGPVSAVQDHFGPCYRCLRERHVPGDIFEFTVIAAPGATARAIGKNGESPARVRIMRSVHANTVRALVRRSRYPGRGLRRGHWYEVISD